MATLRKLLRRVSPDQGLSLVEVVVALMVFSIIALGVGTSTATILKMTEDTRSRQVASNLATSELDLARAAEDPFDIVNGIKTTVISGVTYTITRTTSWVETSGADVGCGTGTGTMQSKRVNVTVTWSGMLTTTKPVRSDTLISPDERINDPSLGTIRISVLNVAGTGSSGVDVAITPTTGGAALAVQPDDTDTDGCSYALKVEPGTYKVALARAGSVDTDQVAAPFKSAVVTAGGSVAVQFQYDYAANFTLAYASNYTGAAPKLPTNLDTTFLSTFGLDFQSGVKSTASLHPLPSGYAGLAGKYVAPVSGGTAGCISVDPAAWSADKVKGVDLAAGVRSPNVAAAPGGTATMPIPMGVLSVKTTSNAYVFADSATAGGSAKDPGCAVAMTYTFGLVTAGTNSIALPYGSWKLSTSTTAAGTVKTPIPDANLGLLGSAVNLFTGGGVVTLDPRLPL